MINRPRRKPRQVNSDQATSSVLKVTPEQFFIITYNSISRGGVTKSLSEEVVKDFLTQVDEIFKNAKSDKDEFQNEYMSIAYEVGILIPTQSQIDRALNPNPITLD